jgi:thiamine biosynthesis lipoprotein ApbE
MAETPNLDGHHQATVQRIFSHPAGHNIEWHDVLSLLGQAGSVSEESDGLYKVTIGSETETFRAPKSGNIDDQQVVDLRRMLEGAGITAVGPT